MQQQSLQCRPSLIIEEDKLRFFFVDNGFKVTDIAMLFCVSNRTIERRQNGNTNVGVTN